MVKKLINLNIDTKKTKTLKKKILKMKLQNMKYK